jgi:rhodanese-related sulfurtransferase
VREPHEYEIANLGGELIPLATIPQNIDKISKDIPVVLQCRSGGRSMQAAMFLSQNLGMKNLFNLSGGILAWKEAFDPSMKCT